MQDKYISIVIPAYNCEQYIGRCLESVLKQTYDKLEIILINDGSTDQTAEICRDYANNDTRIKYVEQQNYGVAYTRKKAIELASGQYLGFVDADDYIDVDMYEQMILWMQEAELVTSGYFFQNKRQYDAISTGMYKTEEERKCFYENMLVFKNTGSIGISTNLWSKLFVTQKMKEVVQTTALDVFIGEDAEILFKYILKCNAIYVSRICSYHYELNKNSIMNSVNKSYLMNVNSLYLALEKEFQQSLYRDILLPKWNHFIWRMIQLAPQFMGFDIEKKERPIKYLNPYTNLLKEKKVILYGAGTVGRDFYKLNQKTAEFLIVLWVDAKWNKLQKEGLSVSPTEKILTVDYDYILIAVKGQEDASEIRKQLKQNKINNSRILWKDPIMLDD